MWNYLVSIWKKKPKLIGAEKEEALLADDTLARSTFGAYRDLGEDMIKATAHWVLNKGAYWGKPTHFGRVKHDY